MIVLASMVYAPQPPPPATDALAGLPVVARRVSADRAPSDCDLSLALAEAAEASPEDPGPLLEEVLSCDRSSPIAPARGDHGLGLRALEVARAEPDPLEATRRALAVHELGQAIRYGSVIHQLVGLALQLDAARLLEERADAIVDPEARLWVAERLRERAAAEPRLTVAIDRALCPWMTHGLGPLGWWLERDAMAELDDLEPVLAHGTEAEILAATAAIEREEAAAWWTSPVTVGMGRALGESALDARRLRDRLAALELRLVQG
jgi:hypothetical protein